MSHYKSCTQYVKKIRLYDRIINYRNKKRTVIVRFLERINLMQKRNERKRNI